MTTTFRTALVGAALPLALLIFAPAMAQTPMAASDQPGAAAPVPDEPGAAEGQSAAVPAEPAAPAPAPTPAAPPPSAPSGSVAPPPAGKGQVVFYRPSRMTGAALAFTIREGDRLVGKVGNGSYFVHVAEPGEHTYAIKSEATDTLTLEIDAGETYYVEQTIGMGLVVGRPHLAPGTQGAFERKPLRLSKWKDPTAAPATPQ